MARQSGWAKMSCEDDDTFASGSRQFIEVSRHEARDSFSVYVCALSLSQCTFSLLVSLLRFVWIPIYRKNLDKVF